MTRNFRPCQLPMIDHIIKNKRCAVYAGVGLGKTSAVFKALDDLSLVEKNYPVLVVATLRVAKDVWVDEAREWEQFSHLKVVSITGTPDERLAAMRQRADYYCVNFENVPWLIEKLGNKWPFKTIVVDECSKLRGFRLRQGTQRSRALFARSFGNVGRFIELTGTPASNGLAGLWGQLYFLDQGKRLGKSFSAFTQRWFQTGFDGFSIKPLPNAQNEIMSRIQDVCLSVDPKDYFKLEDPIPNKVYVDLPPAAMKKYKEMEKHLYTEIAGKQIEALNAAAKTNNCLQLANGAVYTDDKGSWEEVHKAKIEALEDIIEESNGATVMISYNFVSDKERLLKHFPDAVDLSIDKNLKAFKAGKHQIGIAHPASLGHGVDGLQKVTNILIFFGHSWDLELFDQIVGRIGPVRQMQSGMNRPVFLHFIIARGTLDEAVMIRRDSKRDIQDILLDFLKLRGQSDT